MKTLLILLGLLTVACGGGAEAASAEPVNVTAPAAYAEIAFSNPWQTAVELHHHGESDLTIISTPRFWTEPAEGDRVSFYAEKMYLVRLDDWCQFENDEKCAMVPESALPISEWYFEEGTDYLLYFADNGTEGTDDDIFIYAEPMGHLQDEIQPVY